ncbi:MAG: extracellular solute-binding protein [Erysipelotrichaceae bacterium]|nr:extracellular solute-binding protein [Erysipelotrichaceae bacterium]
MKKLMKLILSLAMIAAVAGCSNNKTSGDENVTISVWHTFTEGQQELLETIADEFEAANEGIIVEVTNTGSASEFQAKVTDSVINGVGPNLIFEYASYAKSFDIEGADYLLSFEDYWDFDYKSTLTSEGLYAEGTNFSDGKLHVAPVYTAGAVLFCNKALYDEAGVAIPTTWDEVKTSSKAIYEKTGAVGLSLDSLTDIAQLIIYQSHEGKIVDLEKNEVAFNDAETIKWLERWAEGVHEGYFQVAAQGADGYNSSDINNGLIASYIGSSAGIPYVNLDNIGGELVCARVPMISSADYENAGIIWTRGAIGFKDEDETVNQATADFVEYFISQNGRWVVELNANTPYKAVAESADYQAHVASDKALTALADQIPTSFVAPVFTGVTEMRNELSALMKGAAASDYDPKTALETCANNINAAMNQ